MFEDRPASDGSNACLLFGDEKVAFLHDSIQELEDAGENEEARIISQDPSVTASSRHSRRVDAPDTAVHR